MVVFFAVKEGSKGISVQVAKSGMGINGWLSSVPDPNLHCVRWEVWRTGGIHFFRSFLGRGEGHFWSPNFILGTSNVHKRGKSAFTIHEGWNTNRALQRTHP